MQEQVIKQALKVLQMEQVDRRTLVVAHSVCVKMENERELMNRLVKTFQDLSTWKVWSDGLHNSANWNGDSKEFQVGSKFSQEIKLGFPIGVTVSNETVTAVNQDENTYRVMWNKEESGIAACHIWSFDCSDNQVEVTNVEVFHGWPILLVKPLVSTRWNDMFQKAVEGIVSFSK